jgi:hypothetical protein
MVIPCDGVRFIEISKDSLGDKLVKNFRKNPVQKQKKFGFSISKKKKKVKFWLQSDQWISLSCQGFINVISHLSFFHNISFLPF